MPLMGTWLQSAGTWAATQSPPLSVLCQAPGGRVSQGVALKSCSTLLYPLHGQSTRVGHAGMGPNAAALAGSRKKPPFHDVPWSCLCRTHSFVRLLMGDRSPKVLSLKGCLLPM